MIQRAIMGIALAALVAPAAKADPTYTTFDVPGTGTGAGQGTIPLDNNNPGAVAGQAIDGGNVTHGFLVQGL